MKKLLGILVLGLLWCNISFANESGGIKEPGSDQKCFNIFESENIFERKFLPHVNKDKGVLVSYAGCNKFYDDWSWDYSLRADIDLAHTRAYNKCVKNEMPQYNLTGCHLFSIDDVIVWGKDAAFIEKVEKDIKIKLAKLAKIEKNLCNEGNCYNGKGTQKWPDGYMYVGEIKDGLRHGQGTSTWPDGIKYVGEWKNDYQIKGTETFADGFKYVGEFKDNLRHGQGTGTWPDGIKYVGEWKNGLRHGQGTTTNLNGFKYVGEWKNGLRHGQGTTTTLDGKKYVGQWKDDHYISGQVTFNVRDKVNAGNLQDEVNAGIEELKDKLDYAYGFLFDGQKNDIFKKNDPSTLKKLTFKKKTNFRTRYPKARWDGGLRMKPKNLKGFSYIAEYEDNIKIEILIETSDVMKKMDKETQMKVAEKKARYYANIFGHMPHFIKTVNRKILVHKYDIKPLAGGWAGGRKKEFHIVEQGDGCIGYYNSYQDYCYATDFLITLHELAHVVQDYTKVIVPSKWVKAKNSDEKFCSKYAMKNDKEDFAESLVCWFALRYIKHRLEPTRVNRAEKFIENRLKFFDELDLNVHPWFN